MAGLASTTSLTVTVEGAYSWCKVPSDLQGSPTATGQDCAVCVAGELDNGAHLGLLGWPSILCLLLLLGAALHHMQEHMRPGRRNSTPYAANIGLQGSGSTQRGHLKDRQPDAGA